MIKFKQIFSWIFSRTCSIKVLYNFPCLSSGSVNGATEIDRACGIKNAVYPDKM